MALFQETWQFQGLGGAKWNEVYYSVQGSLESASQFSAAFIKKRTDCLHAAFTWTKVRITQVLDKSVHTLVNINAPGTVAGVEAPANPGEAAVINLASSIRSGNRKLWMRGLPENAINFSSTTGRSVLNPAFEGNLRTFINGICAPGYTYAIKRKKTGIANGIVKTRVLQVDGTAANGTSIITTKDAHLLVEGNYVEFTTMEPKLFPGLRGPFKVLGTNGLTFTVQYSVPQNELIKSDTGYSAKLSYWEDAVINPAISGFSYGGVRRTKNDGTGSRGARRAQRLRN